MCGIAGLIGESTQPKVSYLLTTRLLALLERRGEDATGLWGTQRGELNGKKGPSIIYHKEPTKSSEFVRYSNVWKKIRKFNPNLLLLHARSATPGVGMPSFNKNNHPFVSRDMSLSIIHNGKVPEYHSLKDKFKTFSNCDSEILLRILVSEQEPIDGFDGVVDTDHKKKRLSGIRKIWSLADAAHMAVGVGEFFPDGTRHLWLWRNIHRPLWLADMRDTLGQVFFFSEPTIWYDAMKESQEIKNFLSKRQRLIEIPTEQVWHFEIDPKRPVVAGGQYQKFAIKSGVLKTCSAGDIVGIEGEEDKSIKPVTSIICNLDDEDEPLEKVPNARTTVVTRGKGTTSLNTTYPLVNRSSKSGGVDKHSHSAWAGSAWNGTGTHQSDRRSSSLDGYGPASQHHHSSGVLGLDKVDPKVNGSLLTEIEKACSDIKEEAENICNLVGKTISGSNNTVPVGVSADIHVEIEKVCSNIGEEAVGVKTNISNLVKEDSISADTLADLLNHLSSALLDIQATKLMITDVSI